VAGAIPGAIGLARGGGNILWFIAIRGDEAAVDAVEAAVLA
jgi:hypothetical protein